MSKKLISICSTAYNEEEALGPFLDSVLSFIQKNEDHYSFEIVLCENGSSDKTLDIIHEKKKVFRNLRYIKLTRNFGHQGGLLSALSAAKGDVIIMLDADGQHPIELANRMIQKWEEGYLVVNTKKLVSGNFIGEIPTRLFYALMKLFTNMEVGQSDFRLVDRRVLDTLLELPEKQKFIRGLINWQGYRECKLKYQVNPRIAGRSKFSFTKLYDFAFLGITSFSTTPLRILVNLGFLMLIPSLILLLWHVVLSIEYLINGNIQNLPPGWLTICTLITFFGSIQLLSVGLLGEYVGRIYTEIKARPNFIIEEEG